MTEIRPEFGLPGRRDPQTQGVVKARRRLRARDLREYRTTGIHPARQEVPNLPAGRVVEVKILRVLAVQADVQNADHQGAFDELGPCLWCARMLAGESEEDYVLDPNDTLAVNPPGGHFASDFKAANGTHIYAGLADEPVFFAGRAQRGWTLLFGHGESWVDEPPLADLCP